MVWHKLIQRGPSLGGRDPSQLSPRELRILNLIGLGMPNKQIAVELNLSVKTVESHRERIKYKLGLSSGAELNQYARDWMRTRGLQSAVDEARLPKLENPAVPVPG